MISNNPLKCPIAEFLCIAIITATTVAINNTAESMKQPLSSSSTAAVAHTLARILFNLLFNLIHSIQFHFFPLEITLEKVDNKESQENITSNAQFVHICGQWSSSCEYRKNLAVFLKYFIFILYSIIARSKSSSCFKC